MDSRDSLNTFI